MPFAATTLDRVMGVLSLPLTRFYIEAVQDALDHAAVYGGDAAIARIEGYLTEYDTQQAALTAAVANSGLIEAGPLKWALGSRNAGYNKEITRLRNSISAALNLAHIMPRSGGVRLLRG